jgi:hypothetical protein
MNMTCDEILDALTPYTGTFPENALRAATEKLPELTPALLNTLEDAISDPYRTIQKDSMLPTFALHLLGQAREVRAFPLLLRMARLPKEQIDGLLGDTICEGLPQALASTCNGDWEALKILVEDAQAYEFCRSTGLMAMLCMVAEGDLEKEPVLDYCQYLLTEGLEREYSYIWDAAINTALELGVGPCENAIRQALDDGMVDGWGPSIQELERELKRKQPLDLKERGLTHYRYSGDIIDEMSGWACFDTDLFEAEEMTILPKIEHNYQYTHHYEPAPDLQPIRREGPKIGRNDPCPCDSGKKYKKCCGK